MLNIGLNFVLFFLAKSFSDNMKDFLGLYFSRKLKNDFVKFGFIRFDLISSGMIFPSFSTTKSTSAFDFVLQNFTDEERKIIDGVIGQVIKDLMSKIMA